MTNDLHVYMDLGDFIPEEYEFGFAIRGRSYKFTYAEATVDEVLRLLAGDDAKGDYITKLRDVVTKFLSKVLSEGDATQLADDLAVLPYKSNRGSLDIATLFDTIQSRVKKNENGANTTKAA